MRREYSCSPSEVDSALLCQLKGGDRDVIGNHVSEFCSRTLVLSRVDSLTVYAITGSAFILTVTRRPALVLSDSKIPWFLRHDFQVCVQVCIRSFQRQAHDCNHRKCYESLRAFRFSH